VISNFSKARLQSMKRNQSGFTLVELAIVVVILAILAYIFVVDQDPNKARAAKLQQAISAHTGAANVYRAEMGCWPSKMANLAAKQPNAGTNTTACGTDVTSRWSSPYLQSAAFDANGHLSLDAVVPNAVGQLVVGSAVAGVTPVFYRITPLENALADRLVTTCNGNIGSGNCAATAVTGSTTQKYVDYRMGQI
jgi:prepilin-type N-terminal cleavage/methylation domain-containing protein